MENRENGEKDALATLGGGCFWCLDAVYRRVRGVKSVTSGYMGGHITSPSYRMVCEGDTGHAEVVQIAYDSGTISYQQILDIFFRVHDPTTLNRQGADVGSQYRSAIFFHDREQEETVREMISSLKKSSEFSERNIVTEIVSASRFYPAEEYHQDYFARNPGQPYCAMVVQPKVEKFLKNFPDLHSDTV
jgi:peptide-methionine (S)-S-oxide reductase